MNNIVNLDRAFPLVHALSGTLKYFNNQRPNGKLIEGYSSSQMFDSAGNTHVEALAAECAQRLPPDEQNPARSEIEQEISELEYRFPQLKQWIGST